MPRGLKQSSSQIQISQESQITTDALAPQFLSKRVDLQLNPLDNEVFVLTGLKIDFNDATPIWYGLGVGNFQRYQRCSISTTEQTTFAGIESPSVLGAGNLSYFIRNTTVAGEGDLYTVVDNNAMDSPPASMDYIGIIATNDFFVNYAVDDGFESGQALNVSVRLFGYRATADSSTYAALVQSELLSQ